MEDWWFKARLNWDSVFEEMDDIELATFIRALWRYARTGEKEKISGAGKIAYAMAIRDLMDDDQHRKAVSDKRKAAGSAGGTAKANRQKATVEEAVAGMVEKAEEVNHDYDLTVDEPEQVSTGVKAVRDNITTMSGGNWAELAEMMEAGMTDEMVSLAVDEACSHGARTWAYVRSILNEWITHDVKSVADAKKYGENRKRARSGTTAQRQSKVERMHETQYEQREYTNTDDPVSRLMAGWEGTG